MKLTASAKFMGVVLIIVSAYIAWVSFLITGSLPTECQETATVAQVLEVNKHEIIVKSTDSRIFTVQNSASLSRIGPGLPVCLR